jgi:hypothetical protein
MIVRRWCTWVLEPHFAPVVRFLQDQPLIYANGRTGDTNFPHRIGDAVHETYTITDGQRAAIEKIIAERRWVEPPRWRAWAEVVQREGRDLYRITVCPGAEDDDVLRGLVAARPDGIPGEITIGPLNERTWDVNNPRLPPLPSERKRGKRADYVTVCRRLVVERAGELGLLIES